MTAKKVLAVGSAVEVHLDVPATVLPVVLLAKLQPHLKVPHVGDELFSGQLHVLELLAAIHGYQEVKNV